MNQKIFKNIYWNFWINSVYFNYFNNVNNAKINSNTVIGNYKTRQEKNEFAHYDDVIDNNILMK